MIMWIYIYPSGRIKDMVIGGRLNDGIAVTIPEDFDFDTLSDWRFDGTELVYDPLPTSEDKIVE